MHLLVNEMYESQNARCNDTNYRGTSFIAAAIDDVSVGTITGVCVKTRSWYRYMDMSTNWPLGFDSRRKDTASHISLFLVTHAVALPAKVQMLV